MASMPQGDIPGNRQHIEGGSFASVASNGANGRLSQIGPFPWPVIYRGGAFIPTGATNATVGTATTSASFRQIDVYRGGTIGTITASANRLARLSLTASQASFQPSAFATQSAQIVPAGETIWFSQQTVGGAVAGATELAAGELTADFEIA